MEGENGRIPLLVKRIFTYTAEQEMLVLGKGG